MGGPAIIDGKYHLYTDNFLPCKFMVNNVAYCSSENYFQCAKATNAHDHEIVRRSGSGMDCWLAGAQIDLRPDWEQVKVREMYVGNKAKFEQNFDFGKQLVATKGPIVFGGSTSFWNKWNGLILDRVRAELRQDQQIVEKIKQLMDKYEQTNVNKNIHFTSLIAASRLQLFFKFISPFLRRL
ncbi:unnamed protein product [Didymodactylos carnosus]|uniref:NADAR domain-containing protein n=1 Tax=Didymodactylos carnosus TaxID=1234261 RepID=A0A814LFT0_9BILA|nr:unnamed protein product [Didymodactylos carnosus]CAF1100281.1 unnamed protein product [Didymodactylos carnosus]CAF3832955.1 unnamed protein product [Didymodactylos carnosus]CAF3861698.1 unnamed protein product [Didymodactylos carnosus]